mmetsp:Transcript_9693/g.11936  ORF Transcript_9693/g.11936 Transcript_9693/m.11936 type:complete len:119 (-) Transcript_9693:234-590(-)
MLVPCTEQYLVDIDKQPMVMRPLDLHLSPKQKNFYHFLGMTFGVILFLAGLFLLFKCWKEMRRRKLNELRGLEPRKPRLSVSGLVQTEVQTGAIDAAECAIDVPPTNSPIGGARLQVL